MWEIQYKGLVGGEMHRLDTRCHSKQTDYHALMLKHSRHGHYKKFFFYLFISHCSGKNEISDNCHTTRHVLLESLFWLSFHIYNRNRITYDPLMWTE